MPAPGWWQRLVEEIARAAERAAAEGVQPVLVCSGALRLPLRRLLGRFLPRLPVIRYEEVNAAKVSMQTKAVVGGDLV